MLCLTSQTLLPRGFRAGGYSRTFPSTISTVPFVRRPGLSAEFCPRPFALAARSINGNAIARSNGIEKKLIRLLEKEIKQTQKEEDNWVSEVPAHIPFDAIKDSNGERTVTMTRQYKNESIKLEAYIPDDDDDIEDEEEDKDDNEEADAHDTEKDEDEGEDYEDNSIPLVVSISKGNGAVLEFGIATLPDEMIIDSLSIKQQDRPDDEVTDYGPDFSDLDEDMQNTFYKYLDVRGVNLSTVQFLHAYIDDKQGIFNLAQKYQEFCRAMTCSKDMHSQHNRMRRLRTSC